MELKTEKMAQGEISTSGVPGRWAGQHLNIYLLENAHGLFRLGSLLIERGFEVETISSYARRFGMSRQAVNQKIKRDGELIAFEFHGWLGRHTIYVVH